MAFDGITMNALCCELNRELTGMKITKIAQPEPEELLLTLKGDGKTLRLLLSANPSLPLIYITVENKPSPMTAPNFCMMLRKHIGNGRILSVEQIGLERVLRLRIQHLDDLKDVKEKFLYIEIMGKHSNLIFTDSENKIVDSIKHISAEKSSVREVLPGRDYFIPPQEGKTDPLNATEDDFYRAMEKPLSITKAIYQSFVGISPQAANEVVYEAGLDGDASVSSLNDDEKKRLCQCFFKMLTQIKSASYAPELISDEKGNPVDFAPFHVKAYGNLEHISYDSVSRLLSDYYARKNAAVNIKQKTSDLTHILHTLLDRARKKELIQKKQLSDTDKMDKFRIYGELLTTYGYMASPGDKSVTVDNYYTNEKLTIPLDETLSAIDNAKKYFNRYNKLKRTKEAVTLQLEETQKTIFHLESVLSALSFAEDEKDIAEIRREMAESGFIRKHRGKKDKAPGKSKPLHFVTEDGFHIYVGKNNFQNDYLTFKLGNGGDWWFHAKSVHGSHVLVKTEGKELPDEVYEIAASLAAYYSQGKDSPKLEIDYVQRKEVKKPVGAAPGFVVYYTNYSMMAEPKIYGVTPVD